MKKYVIALFALMLLAGNSCQEKIDIEKEKAAIIVVIEEETNAYLARDIDRHNECFIQDETAVGIMVGKDGLYDGWEVISAAYKSIYENSPEPLNLKVKNENYKIKVYRDCAWAVYDEYTVNENDSISSGPRCIRFLEKVDDEWKIVLLTGLSREDTDQGGSETESETEEIEEGEVEAETEAETETEDTE